jgi:two-component system, LytTR family, response regulator
MQNLLTCVIVDDELLAQELIEKFVNRIPYLQCIGKCFTAMDAFVMINEKMPDIIFLDINMPEMTGIEFLKSLTNIRPQVIITTANSLHAIEGYEHDVADFLLKPFPFDRFLKAINKVQQRMIDKKKNVQTIVEAKEDSVDLTDSKDEQEEEMYLLVKQDKKLVKIYPSEIIFVEGMKDYLKIHIKSKFIIIYMTMTRMEQLLPKTKFLRINRSYIISLAAMKSIEGNMIEMSNDRKLDMGSSYRDALKEYFKSKTLI